ncbi:predicted protein [Naegleria gruberi]|uniref:Predicted protein n=1 Tax=Naegleria gruberi TaxID=5762 RepID=D2VSV3_NAEGR|nr:uncharacterized protein NAEGRDRAFT_72073 [Naegleria gruberi]EFC39965.1 predicted protein [Naegleria gruberi]|eukprot:XP_002672709.1 predicted protein [Naegleria gruberi strain NEG-M]
MVLHVTILEITNLDNKHTDPNYTSDPYVVVSIDHKQFANTDDHFRTNIQKDTLNPKYNETFQFEIPKQSTFENIDIVFEVYDWRVIGKNASMGQAQTSLACLRNQFVDCDSSMQSEKKGEEVHEQENSTSRKRKLYKKEPQRLKLELSRNRNAFIEIEMMVDETDRRHY